MKIDYTCYCGLYCGNCAVKNKVEPAAKVLYEAMKEFGFEEIAPFFLDSDKFWSFLKRMSVEGVCISCKAGGGNPGCKIRPCAKERNVETCTLCESYPCEHFTDFFKNYPFLEQDNAYLRENGLESWKKLQTERQSKRMESVDTDVE